jgi:hypothetical protein
VHLLHHYFQCLLKHVRKLTVPCSNIFLWIFYCPVIGAADKLICALAPERICIIKLSFKDASQSCRQYGMLIKKHSMKLSFRFLSLQVYLSNILYLILI